MTTNVTVETDRKDERKRKRGAIVKFSLAGAALLGIAAAATSANWSDDAWFTADATAADGIELQGSVDGGTTWELADTAPGITFSPTELVNMVPDSTYTFEVQLWNDSDVPLDVVAATVVGGGILADVQDVTVSADDPGVIAAGDDSTVVEVTVVTPVDWDEVNIGGTGTVTLQFTGTTLSNP